MSEWITLLASTAVLVIALYVIWLASPAKRSASDFLVGSGGFFALWVGLFLVLRVLS